jgi:hypothetical protein
MAVDVRTDIAQAIYQWKPLAEKYGDMYGVDKNVILSVINTESSGNPNEGKAPHAMGLMQIIESTWNSIAERIGVNGSPFDPELNIRFGTYYLSEQAKANGGSIEAALKQYGGYANGDNEEQWSAYKTEVLNNAQSISDGKVSMNVSGSTSGSSSSKDPRGILKFAKFAQSLAFTKQMVEGFEQGMEYTLHSYLANFMHKFYHNMYYIPTLPNNKVMVIKPETMFIDPPSCNMVYPSMKMSLGFSRSPKQEPTRILMISDPVTNIFGMSGGTLSQLVTMAFIDNNEDGTQKVVGLGTMENKRYPMRNLSSFEKKNGVRILRSNQGEDLYLFLVSDQKPTTTTSAGKTVQSTILTSNTNPEGIGQTLSELAAYTLLRNRYENRNGSMQMYFNPYMVPGFPFLSIEGSDTSSLNVYGYVTDVTHQITERSWSTHVGFTGTHIGTEPRPPAFPIIENEYVSDISATYKAMLGDAVSRIDEAGAQACRTAYATSDDSVSSMLKKVWRPITTMEEHLSTVCDGATVVEDRNLRWFKNAEGADFFDTAVQEKIKGYTRNIMDGFAFNEADVR